jgi:hypothetical protein
MTDADETISLGGKTWTIPPLPFVVCKKMQPALIRLSQKAVHAASTDNLSAFTEEDIEDLAKWVWTATQNASDGEAVTRDQFEHLRFSVQDLLVAYPPVARACGLKWGKAKPNGEGESEEGKQTGTS